MVRFLRVFFLLGWVFKWDVFVGINDPVADKLLKRAAAMPALPPPEDKTITTLYIGNLGSLTEQDIRYVSLNLLFLFTNAFDYFFVNQNKPVLIFTYKVVKAKAVFKFRKKKI